MSTRRRTHEPASTVKPGLTPDRRRRLVENDEYAAFIRRAVRAYGRRVSTGDIEALADLVALSPHVDHAVADAVGGLRGFGYSWADLANRLGITRQAAQQRWSGRGD